MRCNCEDGLRCSTVSVCYMEQELADKQEDVDSVRAENDALRSRVEFLLGVIDAREARLAEAEAAIRQALEDFDGGEAGHAHRALLAYKSDSATHREDVK